jgi:transposase InsO family protein
MEANVHRRRFSRNVGPKDVPTAVKNPQSNAMCERTHQTAANVLRALSRVHPQAGALIDSALATSMRAAPASVHRTL